MSAGASSHRLIGPLSYSRTPVYAPRANGPAALPAERRVLARLGWEGKQGAFLNILPGFWCCGEKFLIILKCCNVEFFNTLLDDVFETFTLLQTGKIAGITVVLIGQVFWEGLINWSLLVESGLISQEDLSLFHFAETAEEAWNITKANDEQPVSK